VLGSVSRQEEWEGRVVVFAARDRDGAEPSFVGPGAVIAVAGKRVLCSGCGIAGNLLERVVEILVQGGGVAVVDGREGFDSTVRVGGHGVGDF